MPCEPARARQMLRDGKAAIFRRVPFTIILKNREDGEAQPIATKIDPGSKTTGLALVAEFEDRGPTVVWAGELTHRGAVIRDALMARRAIRRSRRSRKTRYRKPRFLNRTRPAGWLPPSLQHRVETVLTWVERLRKFSPVSTLSQELVKFDLQKMENPEISGVEYQQGTLAGYEVREYLLNKWNRTCAYCGAKDVPLEIDHIHPRSKGGADRVSNLTLACHDCNQKKSSRTIEEFLKGKPEVLKRVLAQAKMPLRDATAVNATRKSLLNRLESTGLPVETGSGGRTKYNRSRQSYPKAHWIDAACVGASGESVALDPGMTPLRIKATGHGMRQMCGTDKFGFPFRHRTRTKEYFGFQTGDRVHAVVPTGKHAGSHTGRILVRASGNFDIQTGTGRFTLSHKYCFRLHRKDGYAYAI